MVFCCIEQTYEEEAESTLVEVIPSKTAAKTAANGSSGKIPSPLTFENTEKRKKFAVVVPKDVSEGQTLRVYSPDKVQTMYVVVPQGHGPGDTFHVKFSSAKNGPTAATQEYHPQPGCVNVLDRLLTPTPCFPEVIATPIPSATAEQVEEEEADAQRSPESTEKDGDANSIIRDASPGTKRPVVLVDAEEERSSTSSKKEPPESAVDPEACLLDLDEEDNNNNNNNDSENGGGGDDDDDLGRSPSPGAATAPPRLSNSSGEPKPLASPVISVSPPYKPPTQRRYMNNYDYEDDEDEIEQKVLLVRVPRGVPVGSIIHVEIPGENRTVAATVPAGVSSFHVCYTPRPEPLLAPRSQPQLRQLPPPSRQPPPKQQQQQKQQEKVGQRALRQIPPGPRPEDTPPQQIQEEYELNPNRNKAAPVIAGAAPRTAEQKLLLVRVPAGTVPGSTIHVSVPDEPGRILAAIVPPGNVREFHISYEARRVPIVQARSPTPNMSSSFMPTASAYSKGRTWRPQEPPAAYPAAQLQQHHHHLLTTSSRGRTQERRNDHNSAGDRLSSF